MPESLPQKPPKSLKSRRDGLFCAIIWLLSPYRLCDVILRSAIAEALGLMFGPLLIYALWEVFLNESCKSGWLILSVAIAGIIWSHILSATVFFFMGIVALPPLLAFRHRPLRVILKDVCITILLTVALTAGFLVPFLDFYTSHHLRIQSGFSSCVQHSLEPAQMLSPFLPFSGFSTDLGSPMQDEMPLGVGWCLLIAYPLALTALADNDIRRPTGEIRAWILFLLLLASILLFMTTYLFPWGATDGVTGTIVHLLSTIQFPWRYLGPASLLFILLIGIIAAHTHCPLGHWALAIAAALAIVEGGYGIGSFMHAAERITTEEVYASCMSGVGFYFPEGLGKHFIDDWTNIAPQVCSGDVAIRDWTSVTPQQFEIDVTNDSDYTQLIRLPLFWNRFFTAIGPDGQDNPALFDDEGYLGMRLEPQSSGTFEIVFIEPLTWRITEAISLAAMFMTSVITLGKQFPSSDRKPIRFGGRS